MKAGDRVDDEALDAQHPIARKEHAVIGAEESALVDSGEIDPVTLRLEAVVDVGRKHANVVARVLAGQGMNAIGAELDLFSGPGGGNPQGSLQSHEPALELRLVAGLDVETRQPGVATHRPSVEHCKLGILHD